MQWKKQYWSNWRLSDKTLEGVCESYHKCVVLQNPQPIELSNAIVNIIPEFNIYERKTILEEYAFVDGY
jgi:hypothetical protein